MLAMYEEQESTLAERVGLCLAPAAQTDDGPRYQLLERSSLTQVFPGGPVPGVALRELEDWLRFPWE